MTIADNLTQIHQSVKKLETQNQRPAGSVKVLAVSKTKPISDLVEAYQVGQRAFGENYVQEAADKKQQLAHLSDIEWHFIGPIQSNKSRIVAETMDWVHTIDRAKIATRLSEQRPSHLPQLNVCVQVNISEETSKSGVMLDELDALIEHVLQQPNLCLRGLMAIPAPQESEQQQIHVYQPLTRAYQTLQSRIKTIDTLSIGMSNDMNAAIASGSSMVRIGTAIFGQRL